MYLCIIILSVENV